MTFLVRTIDATADGREIVREREVLQDALTVGRTSASDVHLPDLALDQDHARIEKLDDGTVRVSALGDLGFKQGGKTRRAAVIDPDKSAELGFGTFRLAFDTAESGQLRLTVSQQKAVTNGPVVADGFALASAMPSKRAMAWAGLVAILMAFLAIPVWSHLHREDKSAGAADFNQVTMDAAWNPGALSTAHHSLENSCEACHVEPFVSVRDSTCLSCHTDIADHADKPRMITSRGPLSAWDGFQWAVADTFGKQGREACTTCHTEHEGEGRMEPTAQQFCADCHNGLDTRLTDTTLASAGDFGTDHPQLQAVVWTEPGQGKAARVSLAGNPTHNDGLRFPHDMHLSAGGGVARMAASLKKYGGQLQCADCHTPDSEGRNFLDVEMEENCESCHSLVYDRVGSTFRTLRHGDVDQMRADLAALDRAPRRPVTSGRRRPGEFGAGGRYYQNFGRPQRNYIGVNTALSKNGVCGECHLPRTTNGRPDVVPVKFRKSYFLNGKFDHDDHRQEECSTCHAATTSKSAQDLLLPDLATCRTCHLGETAVRAQVPSGCAMCHGYHLPSGRKPEDHPDFTPKQVAAIARKSK